MPVSADYAGASNAARRARRAGGAPRPPQPGRLQGRARHPPRRRPRPRPVRGGVSGGLGQRGPRQGAGGLPRAPRPAAQGSLMGDTPHDHDHEHAPGRAADASVRRARPTDAPAVGQVQAAVFRAAYAGTSARGGARPVRARRLRARLARSLTRPPEGVHRLLRGLRRPRRSSARSRWAPPRTPTPGRSGVRSPSSRSTPEARRQGHGRAWSTPAVDILREAGARTLTAWVPSDDEPTQGYFTGSGFGPDGAFRDRVVAPDGGALREVRLVADIAPDGASARPSGRRWPPAGGARSCGRRSPWAWPRGLRHLVRGAGRRLRLEVCRPRALPASLRGGSQFALVGVLASGGGCGGPPRHGRCIARRAQRPVLHADLAPSSVDTWLRKLLAAQLTIDETTADRRPARAARGQRLGFWVTGARCSRAGT